MRVIDTDIPDVKLIEPKVFGDDRGFFMETWQSERYASLGIAGTFIQDNLSFSQKGVVRGLHFQNPNSQGKLVYVLQGEVFDVAVDVRVGSPTYGKWVGNILSAENKQQMWVPEGFAHGFCVTSETALFAYKCTDYYDQSAEVSIRWDDPTIAVEWPLLDITLSGKDQAAPYLDELDQTRLPVYLG